MFSSWKQKIVLVVYVLLILSIPVGSYLAANRQNTKVSAKQDLPPITSLRESTGSAKLLGESPNNSNLSNSADDSTTTPATSFGPTLNLKLILEGRPVNKMAGKIFVGITDLTSSTNIKYLLSFNIDLPDSGEFKGISLAGLTTGTNYKAIIKGPAQIATSSSFVMSPTATNLNNGQSITLTTGDLNEDNLINSADYSIAKAAYGATKNNQNWNANVDFNLDGIINSFDLAIIVRNMAKTGDSGVWVSPPPASGSASIDSPVGSTGGNQGYWLWLPGF